MHRIGHGLLLRKMEDAVLSTRTNPTAPQGLAFAIFQPPVHPVVVLAVKNQAQTIGHKLHEVMADGTIAIVVDDASTDGTSQAAAGAGAWVIQAGKELPFAAAIQQGVRLAASLGDRILVMRA